MITEARRKQIEQKIAELKQKKANTLRLMAQYRQDNLIEFFNKPKEDHGLPANPLQAELLEAWDNPLYKVFVYAGGNRLGKTTILTIICFSVMFGKWPWNDHKIHFTHNKPRKCRILGQGWEQHVKAVLLPELIKWWPKNRKVKTKKNNQGVEYFWEDVKTGSTLEILSNQQDSKAMEGWYGDFIGYDEPPERDNRVACARGLIDRNGRELFTATLLGDPWIDREVIKRTDERGRPDPTVFHIEGESYINVGYGITMEGLNQYKKTLKPEEIEARILGKPSYLQGLVYPEFSRQFKPKGHLVERFPIPSDWMVDIAFDIHPRERQAVLFVATSPKQERWGCDEIWEHGDGDFIADEVLKIINRNNYRVNEILIDPLSKATGEAQKGVDENSTFNKIQKRLWRAGYQLKVASKDKSSGILAVRDHLLGPNKEPSIWFFSDLVRTIYEFEGYMYKDGKIMDADDHMMENLYRLLLLDTKYVEPEDEYEEEEQERQPVNSMTGY